MDRVKIMIIKELIDIRDRLFVCNVSPVGPVDVQLKFCRNTRLPNDLMHWVGNQCGHFIIYLFVFHVYLHIDAIRCKVT